MDQKQQQEIRRYLERYRPANGEANSLIIRAGNALLRSNIRTMAQVAALSDEQIARLRGMGAKTKDFIRQVIEDYKQDQAGADNQKPKEERT